VADITIHKIWPSCVHWSCHKGSRFNCSYNKNCVCQVSHVPLASSCSE